MHARARRKLNHLSGHLLEGWSLDTVAMLCSEAVHGAARRIAELEEAVQRMVMEGLGVPGYHDAMRESMRHVFRMSQYTAPGGGAEGKEVRYGAHQDCSTLTVVCQHEVNGLEVQTGDGEWVHFRPSSPASLVVMAGNELRVRKRASWLILPRLCFLFAREAPG
jgi:hypothetical protein